MIYQCVFWISLFYKVVFSQPWLNNYGNQQYSGFFEEDHLTPVEAKDIRLRWSVPLDSASSFPLSRDRPSFQTCRQHSNNEFFTVYMTTGGKVGLFNGCSGREVATSHSTALVWDRLYLGQDSVYWFHQSAQGAQIVLEALETKLHYRWTFMVPPNGSPYLGGFPSSLVEVRNQVVVFVTPLTVWGVDVATGKQSWVHHFEGWNKPTSQSSSWSIASLYDPHPTGKPLVLVAYTLWGRPRSVVALDGLTGAVVWHSPPGTGPSNSPVGNIGFVPVVTGQQLVYSGAVSEYAAGVASRDVLTGNRAWVSIPPEGHPFLGSRIAASPDVAVAVYGSNSDFSNPLMVWDLAEGGRNRTAFVNGTDPSSGSSCSGLTVVRDPSTSQDTLLAYCCHFDPSSSYCTDSFFTRVDLGPSALGKVVWQTRAPSLSSADFPSGALEPFRYVAGGKWMVVTAHLNISTPTTYTLHMFY